MLDGEILDVIRCGLDRYRFRLPPLFLRPAPVNFFLYAAAALRPAREYEKCLLPTFGIIGPFIRNVA